MKHLPFQSVYRSDFEVVEQRDGNLTFYPHTAQLPVLLRAINLEFYGALPPRIGRVDHRANDFDKIVLKSSARIFCSSLNASRKDQLRLFELTTQDLVSRITIVQQITETTRQGLCHRFRFYGGDDFFPEIYFSGKRVVFADHVLQRFSSRVPNNLGEDLSYFLIIFFGSPGLSMPVGPGHAVIMSCGKSMLAFTYKESETEFFITTCLTINEMNSLGVEMPPRTLTPHYGSAFTRPRVRHWLPASWMLDFYKCWERKVPLDPPLPRLPASPKFNWHWVAHLMRDNVKSKGHGPGSRLIFNDHIPGPCMLELIPGQSEPRVNEVEIHKQIDPQYDWETIFAERYGEGE
jgi:hypothetical protein